MKDLILPMIPATSIIAMTTSDATFWERIAEKWGIGFVGLALFVILARITMKREDERDKKRDAREAEDSKERLRLAAENNALSQALIDQHKEHSQRLERLIKDGNKANADVGVELKNLARRVRCPGTMPPQES